MAIRQDAGYLLRPNRFLRDKVILFFFSFVFLSRRFSGEGSLLTEQVFAIAPSFAAAVALITLFRTPQHAARHTQRNTQPNHNAAQLSQLPALHNLHRLRSVPFRFVSLLFLRLSAEPVPLCEWVLACAGEERQRIQAEILPTYHLSYDRH